MTVTHKTIAACHTTESCHFTGNGFFGYEHRVVEYPRMKRRDTYNKIDKSVASTWFVDGIEVGTIDEAIAAVNAPPVLSPEEAEAFAKVPDEFAPFRPVHKEIGYDLIHRLTEKGAIEMGKSPDRSDGEPWSDSVPTHLRWSPTIRRARS